MLAIDKTLIRVIKDFPKTGILFKDITPLIADQQSFTKICRSFAELTSEVDLIAGVESRGFIFAAGAAALAGKGVLPIRKSGKLPGPVVPQQYQLEYGYAQLEIHSDIYSKGSKVLVIDDVLATGGTAIASISLCQKVGLTVTGAAFLLEIDGLSGRSEISKIFPQLPITTLLES
ncbi:MAG: adenine phosphoribosyltransferase [Actinobacteria bacterium]|jgi:adenine phosphoribosyltransferase|uniref:adenine phosphoribosyltransferase n=1 Tax=freshwater metagenome TaxID=449393 RepID=A0A6J6MS25_9ZZZZ|nr:adenine phosphoribosyltransferase [Actinomycetota bacterium]